MRTLATILFSLALLSSPASATIPDILINGGTEDFSYQQFPAGPIAGTFGSSGSLVADPATEGTAGTTYVLDGFNYLTIIGALEDGTNFVDGGVIIIKSAAPIVPGTYPLDVANGLFVFVDDAVGWVPPSDLWNVNWTNELAAITAAGKYGSVSGSVTIDEIGPSKISGTFEAMVLDPNTSVMLNIVNGTFNAETSTAVESESWGSVKELFR